MDKITTGKIKKFFKGKGFAGAICLSVVAIGISTYLTYDSTLKTIADEEPQKPDSAVSAEQGPIISRNLLLFPVNTSAISLSRCFFVSTILSDRGYSSFISLGVGSFLIMFLLIAFLSFLLRIIIIHHTRKFLSSV